MMTVLPYNPDRIITLLDAVCAQCDDYGKAGCNKAQCLIGFAAQALRFTRRTGSPVIAGASRLLPQGDFRPYYREVILPALAETCRQCRECRENHSADCALALARNCLENTVLPEPLDYPGSVFQYLTLVRQHDQELAAGLAEALKRTESAGS